MIKANALHARLFHRNTIIICILCNSQTLHGEGFVYQEIWLWQMISRQGITRNHLLTHWGRVTHICVSDLTIIGSDNGLSPYRRQAIIWTNAGILIIGPLGTNFSEILIEILTFSFKKMHLKVPSAKRRPFCLGLNVLTLDMLNYFKGYKICTHISNHILDFFSTDGDQIYNGATRYVADPIRSIPFLLMPWRFKQPGHQQAWYWLW